MKETSYIIGFEGYWPESCPITYGSAVIMSNGEVKNSISGQSACLESLDSYKDNALITKITPIEIELELSEKLLVMGVRDEFEYKSILDIRPPDLKIAIVHQPSVLLVVFNKDKFDSHVATVCHNLFLSKLGGTFISYDVLLALSALDAQSPYLLSMRAYGANPKAKMSLRNRCKSEDQLLFDENLERLHEIKYE